jgi:hypothetical protein
MESFSNIDPQYKQNVENYAYNQVMNNSYFHDSQLADNLLIAANANTTDRKLSDFTNDLSHTIHKISSQNAIESRKVVFNKEKQNLQTVEDDEHHESKEDESEDTDEHPNLMHR